MHNFVRIEYRNFFVAVFKNPVPIAILLGFSLHFVREVGGYLYEKFRVNDSCKVSHLLRCIVYVATEH